MLCYFVSEEGCNSQTFLTLYEIILVRLVRYVSFDISSGAHDKECTVKTS